MIRGMNGTANGFVATALLAAVQGKDAFVCTPHAVACRACVVLQPHMRYLGLQGQKLEAFFFLLLLFIICYIGSLRIEKG
jgi:hypothetical protein